MGHAETVHHMTAAHDPHNQRSLVTQRHIGDTLGHGTIPELLPLDKALKSLFLSSGKIAHGFFIATVRTRMMLHKTPRQHFEIGPLRDGGIRDPLTLILWYRRPPLLLHLIEEGAVHIQGNHRNMIHAGEIENRQIKCRIKTPIAVPIALLQKFSFAQLPRHPFIQNRLHLPGKHLKAERQVLAQRIQPGDYLQLPTMVIGVIMVLAQ